MNIIIIKLLLNKLLYNKYNKFINLDFYKDNDKNIYKILLSLFQLHDKLDTDISVEDLILYFYTEYPNTKPDEKVLLDIIFDQISKAEVNNDIAVEYLEKHRQQTVATEVAMKALDVSRGKGDLSTIIELLNHEPIVAEEEESFVSDDLEVLADSVNNGDGLRWRLTTLNKSIGSLRKGDFGFLFARPEVGKTTFLASEISFMAQQIDRPILWFNNEESGSKVMTRCYQAVFGVTQQELFTNLDYYKEEYIRLIQGRIKIKDEATITRKMVESICEEHNPAMIIFDQIDKIAWHDSERYDLKMKAIYQWARELAKTYGPTIGICQAGGTAEGKKYLNMNDVDSSHTAKQGEADFIIGIGATNNDGDEFSRYLSICKNKLSGDADTVPELRHGKMPIVIQPDIARYNDALKWD